MGVEDINKLKEKTAHGNTLFPFDIYNIQWVRGQLCTHYHWHNEIEFIYIIKGSATFMIDGIQTQVKEDQCLLIHSGSIHTRYQLTDIYCEYHAIVFSKDMLLSRLPDVFQTKYIDPFVSGNFCTPQVLSRQSPWQSKILDELSFIVDCFAQQEWGFELSIKASLIRIFSLLLPNSRTHGNSDTQSSLETDNIILLKQIVQYIDHHYQEKINLEDISKFINVSQSHLCRLFKKLTHQTVVEYMNEYRIKQAIPLLQNKNKKVIDIAQEVGFDNISYFIKVFKRIMGYTPVQYRTIEKRKNSAKAPG